MPGTGLPTGGAAEPSVGGGKPEKRLLSGALPRVLLSLLIGGGFLWLLMRGGLPLLPPKEALSRLPWWSLGGYVVVVLCSTFLRTYRWLYLVRPIAPDIDARRVMGISLVGFGVTFLAPLRSGEVVRPYLLAQGGEVSFMQAAGTVGAERVTDGLVLMLLTFVALATATPITPLPDHLGDLPLPVSAVPAAVYSMLLVFAGAFTVMTLFYVAREPARRITRRVLGIVSPRAGDFAADKLSRLADGLSFLPSKGNLLRFMRETLGYWALVMLAQWLLMRGLGLPATLAQATTTVGVQGLGTLVPAGPGMFGAYQIAGFSALAMFFPMSQVTNEGAVFIFVVYCAQFVLNVLQLGLGFWLMSRARR